MARQRDLAQIGSEGFALIDEYFDKKRINRPPTTVPHNMAAGTGTTFRVTQQSCNYRYNISPGSRVFGIISSTRREAMITTLNPPVALNSYEAAQLHDGKYPINYSNTRQMRMAR
ncbi:hypothetical protein H5410_004593 [Solanum commersonii]|uniref:Uncharacterized protein n=1 Tax=Solanum commersonii TaxID=4109 RepID=A0A9J6B8K3_SOLCO|nr:hypothetical protein H5410_004593 [Solanum commersonii]